MSDRKKEKKNKKVKDPTYSYDSLPLLFIAEFIPVLAYIIIP